VARLRKNVDQDGDVVLVLQVEAQNLDPNEFHDGCAVLTRTTFDGEDIEGKDEISLVPESK
jgi:hypothetical protein